MYNFIASCTGVPILGDLINIIAIVFGYVMSGIYWLLENIGLANIGLCIILFTILVKLAMFPLTFNQQKFSKISAVINPEIQAIQKKYKGKKDNDSMTRMQAETKEVYSKYGTSQTGGCLQLLIQMPILLALYEVIRGIPIYVGKISLFYENIANVLSNNYITNVLGATGTGSELTQNIVKKLAVFTPSQWDSLREAAGNSSIVSIITENYEKIKGINSFLGMDLGETPWAMLKDGIFWAVLIPVLAGVAQFISVKLSPSAGSMQGQEDNPMASSMKSMNIIMPLFSLFFCFTFPTGIGLYWAISSVIQVVIQMFINRHFNKIGMDVILAKSAEKASKKRIKKGIPAKTVASAATKSTKSISTVDKSQQPVRKGNAKPGSLAEKAGRASQTNNKK